MNRRKLFILILAILLIGPANLVKSADISESLKGRILLQVEEKGEAWRGPEGIGRLQGSDNRDGIGAGEQGDSRDEVGNIRKDDRDARDRVKESAWTCPRERRPIRGT